MEFKNKPAVDNNNCVKILWTGGWDSTFRLIELSMMNVDILPVYIIDPRRKSKKYELVAMKKIIHELEQLPKTRANILPLMKVNLEDIPEDREITEAYYNIYKSTNLGTQHEWIARLGKMYPGMEMGTESGYPESSHIIHAIQEYGVLKIENGITKLDSEKSTKEGMLVLGWFRFPIIDRTEQDMVEEIKGFGKEYEELMKFIWFCHSPIDGSPCGFCHPCHVKMESNMEWLLPRTAQNRYKLHKSVSKYFGDRVASYFVSMYKSLTQTSHS